MDRSRLKPTSGGRGINYLKFIAALGPLPAADHSLSLLDRMRIIYLNFEPALGALSKRKLEEVVAQRTRTAAA